MSKSTKKLIFNKLEVPKGKDIDIPKDCYVAVEVKREGLSTSTPILANYYFHFNDTFTATYPRAWADKVNNEVLQYNVYKKLLEEDREFLAVPHYLWVREINSVDHPLKAGNDIEKGLIVGSYNFVVDTMPRGLRGLAMEKHTGLTPKRVSNILSRVSATYEEVQAEGINPFKYKKPIVINRKKVYFIKHTDKNLEGGYMPKWVQTKLEEYFNEKYDESFNNFQLDPEMLGSVG